MNQHAPSTVSSQFVKGALHGLLTCTGHGSCELAHILDAVNVQQEVLNSPKGRVSSVAFAKLINLLWLQMNDEFLGLGHKPTKRGSFALMCELAIGADTLKHALIRCIRLQKLLGLSPRLRMKEQANGTLLYLHSDKKISIESAFLIESLLVIYHRFCCWLIAQAVIVKKVSVEYEEPAHAEEYKVLFTCPMEFKQGITGLLLDTNFLNQKVLKSNVDLTQFFEDAPAGILSRPQNDQSFSAKVRQILTYVRDETPPTLQEIAVSLSVTEQTLRRRLKDEGVTFKQLKENIRRDLAVFLLTHNELPIKDVSLRLGFAETSAFQRAFKDWTGVTPANYRDSV